MVKRVSAFLNMYGSHSPPSKGESHATRQITVHRGRTARITVQVRPHRPYYVSLAQMSSHEPPLESPPQHSLLCILLGCICSWIAARTP